MKRFPLLVLPKRFRSSKLPCALRTADGYRCTLRWIEEADRAQLLSFFRSHNPETLKQRYGYLRSGMTEGQAAGLVGVDRSRHVALVVTEDVLRAGRIVAIGRFTLAPDGVTAEPAFIVHEERRRMGMGTVLLEALLQIARERGLRHFTAQTLADNFAMLSLFIKHGARLSPIEGTDGMEVTLDL